MSELVLKEGDIYRWSYNDAVIKRRQDSVSAGTLYWACSQIGIVNSKGFLVDTWSDYTPIAFSAEECKAKLILDYVGTMSDLVEANPSDRAYYLDEDCVDITHSNSFRPAFYIKKNTKRSLDKMKKIIGRCIADKERKIRQLQSELKVLHSDLECVNEDSYLLDLRGISLYDNHYMDGQENA